MAGIASIPEREASLEQTLRSIAPQVDRVSVSLNGYDRWPAFLDDLPNVTAVVRPVNGGDAEKFSEVDDWDGVVVTCDDDLLYPPDYVASLLAGMKRHGSDAIVGFHGGTTSGWNGRASAATDKVIRCLDALEADDSDVNVIGTGAMAFDARRVPIWRDLFRHPNMADVHLACHAHRFGLRMVALAHKEGWLRDICPDDSPMIYASNKEQDRSSRDTRANRRAELGRVNWSAPLSRPRVRVSIATCDRPDLLLALLRDLEREAQWVDLEVSVYEDASTGYAEARAVAANNGWSWYRFPQRLGKRKHWKLVSRELADCRAATADWFVFLPDDVRLVRHALARSVDTWERLEEPSTLTLWRLKDHEGQPNWTGLLPVDRGEAFEVFHVDGIYLCRRATLEAVGYRVPGFPLKPDVTFTSSGVGRGMSLYLHRTGRRMYRVARSLALPVTGAASVMNPDVRDRRFPGVCL